MERILFNELYLLHALCALGLTTSKLIDVFLKVRLRRSQALVMASHQWFGGFCDKGKGSGEVGPLHKS